MKNNNPVRYNKQYLFVIVLAIFIASLLLVACAKDGDNTDDNGGGGGNQQKVEYTLNFDTNGGSTISSITQEEGSTIQKPTDPTKDNFDFDGWFKESALTNAVSFPITLDNNITIYAKWKEQAKIESIQVTRNPLKTTYQIGTEFVQDGIVVTATLSDDTTKVLDSNQFELSIPNMSLAGTPNITVTDKQYSKTTTFSIQVLDQRDWFLFVRDKTTNSNQFEYKYKLNVQAKFLLTLQANIEGNLQYNADSSNSYYKVDKNSGALLSDGTVHTILTGNELSKFKVDTNNELYSYNKEQVESGFQYESSSFAKALFEFTQDQISEVTKINNDYALKYSGSATGFIDSVIGFLDNPILSQFISLPDSDANLQTTVTYANDFIKTFSYDFSISVAAVSLTFHYDLDFVKVGSGVQITPPSFDGVSITESDIQNDLDSINSSFDNYKTLSNSGYNYDLKTKVDFLSKNAIDARLQGRTMRQIADDKVYFWNQAEFDSDYKNGDLYSGKIVDYTRYRVKYNDANNTVKEVTRGIFGIGDKFDTIPNYNNEKIDNYYTLLPQELLQTQNISLIRATQKTNNDTVYSLGLNTPGIISLLNFADETIRVDGNIDQPNEFAIYDIQSGLVITGCEFLITINNIGQLISITANIKGAYNANPYAETDFRGSCTFALNYSLTTNDKGDKYTAPTTDKEVA